MNTLFYKENLNDITYDHFATAAFAAMAAEYANVGVLGIPTGDDIVVFGSEGKENGKFYRRSVVSLRNYCGTLEMLITDAKGRFLVYSKVDGLSAEDVVKELFRQFQAVKQLVETETEPSFRKKEIGKEIIRLWREKAASFVQDMQMEE